MGAAASATVDGKLAKSKESGEADEEAKEEDTASDALLLDRSKLPKDADGRCIPAKGWDAEAAEAALLPVPLAVGFWLDGSWEQSNVEAAKVEKGRAATV